MPSRVADILLEAARQQGELTRERGRIWGGAVANLGQIPAEIMQQRDLQRQRDLQATRLGLEQQRLGLETELTRDTLEQRARQRAADQGIAQLVGQYTTVDPETGLQRTDHPAVSRAAGEKYGQSFATAYLEHAEKLTQAANAIQVSDLALKEKKNRFYADTIGAAANAATPEEYAAKRATLNGWTAALAAKDPVLGRLPEDQAGLKALHDQLLGESEQLARQSRAATLAHTQAQTEKEQAEALKLRAEAARGPRPTAAELDAAEQALLEKQAAAEAGRGPALTPAEEDKLTAYKKRKMTVAEATSAERATKVKGILEGIKSGRIAPESQGLTRQGMWSDLLAEASAQGIDLAKLETEWRATQRFYASANTGLQVRLRQSITKAGDSLGLVDKAADEWNGIAWGPLNQANLALAATGTLGQQAQRSAVKLRGQIADLTAELSQVYQGGGVPTAEAMKLAENNLQGWWATGTIHEMTNQARLNLNIARNAMMTAGAVTPETPAPKPFEPYSGKEKTAGGSGLFLGADGKLHQGSPTGPIR